MSKSILFQTIQFSINTQFITILKQFIFKQLTLALIHIFFLF